MSTIDELKKKFAEDILIDENNYGEKLLKYSSIHHKYLDLYHKCSREMNKLLLDKDKIYGELFHAYRYENLSGGFDISKNTELDIYIRKDEKYYNIAMKYYNQKEIVKYLEECMKIINNLGYTLKTYIEYQKLRLGI